MKKVCFFFFFLLYYVDACKCFTMDLYMIDSVSTIFFCPPILNCTPRKSPGFLQGSEAVSSMSSSSLGEGDLYAAGIEGTSLVPVLAIFCASGEESSDCPW